VALLRYSAPWLQQPQEVVGVNWENPLTQGLRVCWNAATPQINAAGLPPSVVTGTPVVTQSGLALLVTGTTASVQLPIASFPNSSTMFTLAVPNSVSSFNALGFLNSGGNTSLFDRGLLGTSGGVWQIETQSNAGYAYPNGGGSGSMAAGKLVSIASSMTFGSTASQYTNGILAATGATTGTGSSQTVSPTWVVGYGDGVGSNANVLLSLFWDRELSATEHISLALNPWQLFAPQSIWVPVTAAGGGTAVNPAVGNLALTGYAPSIAQSANQSILPGAGSVAITGYAPTVTQSGSLAVAPGVGSVTLTGYAPTVAQSGNLAVSPSAGTVALTGYAPAVAQTVNQAVAPGVGSIGITGYAPTVAQSSGTNIVPGVGSVAITGYAPSIAQTANQTVAPAVGSVTLTGYAPTVTQASASPNIAPNVGALTITGYAPTVVQSGAVGGGGYDDKLKRRYVVKVGNKLIEFKTRAGVENFLQEPPEVPQTAPQPAKVPPKKAVKAEVPIAEIKRLAPDAKALETFNAQLQQMQFDAILKAYEQWQDDEDVEMLLMSI
jgi:hypothetical protein